MILAKRCTFICLSYLMSGNLDSVLKTRGSLGKPRHHIKKQRHYFATKSPYSQRCGFTSSHVWIWELDHKEGWAPKNWCFHTVVLEDSWEGSCPRDTKVINPVNPKRKSPLNIHWKEWCWSSSILTTWC